MTTDPEVEDATSELVRDTFVGFVEDLNKLSRLVGSQDKVFAAALATLTVAMFDKEIATSVFVHAIDTGLESYLDQMVEDGSEPAVWRFEDRADAKRLLSGDFSMKPDGVGRDQSIGQILHEISDVLEHLAQHRMGEKPGLYRKSMILGVRVAL
jgi:hypothetical protein